MAKLKIYSVRDSKTEAFARPFFLQNDQVMHRAILGAKMDTESAMSKHAEDYSVYEIGTFDEDSGQIESKPPEFKLNLIDIKVPENG